MFCAVAVALFAFVDFGCKGWILRVLGWDLMEKFGPFWISCWNMMWVSLGLFDFLIFCSGYV